MKSKLLISSVLFGLVFSANPSAVWANTAIERADVAQQVCKELSEENLTEMGLAPSQWRSQASRDSKGFSIEGQWQTKNGRYIVECDVGYGQSIDQVEISIHKS